MKLPRKLLVLAAASVTALAPTAITVLSLPTPAGAASVQTSAAKKQPTKKGLSVKAKASKGIHIYKHPKPRGGEHDQSLNLKLPDNPNDKPVPKTDPVNVAQTKTGRQPSVVTFTRNTSHAVPTSNDPVDPSEASAGNVVVYVTNEKIGLSTDGGATFHSFNPASFFSDNPDGGTCCDQQVIYLPRIQRFAWLDQYWGNLGGTRGHNRYRLTVFPPSAVTARGLTSFFYWDITAAELPGTNPFLDFPDLAAGTSYLYLTADAGQNGGVNQTFIARIYQDYLLSGSDLATSPHGWRYLDGPLFLGKVAQNTGNTAVWAANTSTSSVGVSTWPESSTSWFGPTSVGILRWPNSDYTTTDPNGATWLATYTGTILASARIGDSLWLAWTAGRGGSDPAFPWLTQPHVELLQLGLSPIRFISQRAIWNPDHAFAYPNLTSASRISQQGSVSELGISLAWGGGLYFVNHAVGDLTTDPFLLYGDATSNANCGCGRWGDYFTIRPAYGGASGAQFSAAGYAYVSGSGYDTHFVEFTGG